MTNITKILIFSLFLPLLLMVKGVFAHGEDVGVIYPDLREPYRSIFTNIIEGIRDSTGDDIKILSVKKDDNVDMVSDWIDTNKITSLIALGSRSQKLLSNLDAPNKIVGAITRPPKENGFEAGVLLTPDPNRIFKEIRRLVPDVQKLYVVYSKANSGWYMDIARQDAARNGIALVEIESMSKKDSLKQYQSLFKNKLEANSAIWLLQDSISSDARLILPMVLEAAWDQKIPVISNKAGHVERGALFALYPDHFELGVSLGEMSQKNKLQAQKYSPFTESLSAANTRTADHLNLEWSRKIERNFNLVFPQR